MRMKVSNILFLNVFLCFILLCPSARAADGATGKAVPDEGFKYTKMHIDDAVKEDGTEEIRSTVSMTVLREDAVEYLKQYEIGYSTSAEKVEVVEAYTQKPDGRRIDASRDGFQITASGGRHGAAPAFSDETTLTIVFPDVEVGDTVTAVVNRSVTDPLFPGKFSHLHSFPKSVIYDDVKLGYSIPVSLKARYKNTGMTETVNKTEGGRQILAWTYKNPTAEKKEPEDGRVSHIGDQPGLAISSFASYREIAESYGARAKPKAAVTDKIRELADKITKGATTPKDQAKALYDWEIANLTYAGNCIGVGAVVPRDLDFVLQNKMGDCKDHATLLQALLAAKGIESSQALIGVNALYELPDPPMVEIINHVIDYVPSLGLFLDATSGMPFGYLPRQLYGKPVLLVDGFKDGSTTPQPPANWSKAVITGKMTINPDGSADGVTTIVMTDPTMAGHDAQQRINNMTDWQREQQGRGMLRQSGYQGTVTVGKGKWDEKTMTYSSDVTYHFKDYVYIGTPGAIAVEPPFSPQYIGRIAGSAMSESARSEKRVHDFLCYSDAVEESYEYKFPGNMNILAVPSDAAQSTSLQNYAAKYNLSGKTFTVSRAFADTTPGPVCKPEIADEYLKLAAKIWPDLKAMVLYK
jgi:transglutaminase-like putative cysteine protease